MTDRLNIQEIESLSKVQNKVIEKYLSTYYTQLIKQVEGVDDQTARQIHIDTEKDIFKHLQAALIMQFNPSLLELVPMTLEEYTTTYLKDKMAALDEINNLLYAFSICKPEKAGDIRMVDNSVKLLLFAKSSNSLAAQQSAAKMQKSDLLWLLKLEADKF